MRLETTPRATTTNLVAALNIGLIGVSLHIYGNGLRIVCGGNGQWKRLCSSIGHVLDDYDDDDDDDDDMAIGQLPILSLVPIPISVHHLGSLGSMGGV